MHERGAGRRSDVGHITTLTFLEGDMQSNRSELFETFSLLCVPISQCANLSSAAKCSQGYWSSGSEREEEVRSARKCPLSTFRAFSPGQNGFDGLTRMHIMQRGLVLGSLHMPGQYSKVSWRCEKCWSSPYTASTSSRAATVQRGNT